MKQTFQWQSPYVEGTFQPPSDKSISHRALILASMSQGTSHIYNLLQSEDVKATCQILRQLGIEMEQTSSVLLIHGKPIAQWRDNQTLDALNSGTTMRLMAGLLSGCKGNYTLVGDESLSRRPMRRITEPLSQMGAEIYSVDGHAPLQIYPHSLHGMTYEMPIASAQVKSSLLLAGTQASGTTTIIENSPTRNHTEQMIPLFGGEIKTQGTTIQIKKQPTWYGTTLNVPGDVSSAAFWIAAALLLPKSQLHIQKVGLNPTRTGFLTALAHMGVHFDVETYCDGNEPYGDIFVKHQFMHSCVIEGEHIPLLIDELPLIALLATQAQGVTEVRNAEELKVKESDRLQLTADVLNALGAHIIVRDDGWTIFGPTPLHGGIVDCKGDHRIAMMATIASLLTNEKVVIDHYESVAISYPNFLKDVSLLIHES